MGNPNYFPQKCPILMPREAGKSSLVELWQLEEKRTLDLAKLIFWTKWVLKEWRVLEIVSQLSWSTLANKSQIISKEEVKDFGSSMVDSNRVSLENVHFLVDSSWNKFHAKDEEVGREGVPLPDSSVGLETRGIAPIDKNGDSRRGDTIQDKFRQTMGKVEEG